MKRKKYKLYVIAAILCIVSLLITFKFCIDIALYNHCYQNCAYKLPRLFIFYAKDNKGEFPKTEEDLIRSGYFRKIKRDEHVIYEYRYDNSLEMEEGWSELNYFEDFNISYGTDINDLEIRNDKLYKKSTNTPFLFFQGPKRKYFQPRYYHQLSLEIYKEIDKIKDIRQKDEK